MPTNWPLLVQVAAGFTGDAAHGNSGIGEVLGIAHIAVLAVLRAEGPRHCRRRAAQAGSPFSTASTSNRLCSSSYPIVLEQLLHTSRLLALFASNTGFCCTGDGLRHHAGRERIEPQAAVLTGDGPGASVPPKPRKARSRRDTCMSGVEASAVVDAVGDRGIPAGALREPAAQVQREAVAVE